MSDKKEHMDKKESQKALKKEILRVSQFSIQEIWAAMRGNVHKSKKHYNRKEKHKGKI